MAEPAIITRRTALVGAFSSLFIPPAAIALIQPALAGQAPMTAAERAEFHMAEFAKAMDEILPAEAHQWNASIAGARGKVWSSRQITYRLPDPESSQRVGKELLIDRMVEFR